jgi:hypothetical protein
VIFVKHNLEEGRRGREAMRAWSTTWKKGGGEERRCVRAHANTFKMVLVAVVVVMVGEVAVVVVVVAVVVLVVVVAAGIGGGGDV